MTEEVKATLSETESKYYDIITNYLMEATKEQNITLYHSSYAPFVVMEQNENRYKTIDTVEELKDCLVNKQLKIALTKELSHQLILQIIKNEDEGFRQFFYNQPRLIHYFTAHSFNEMLEKNKHQPEYMFDLIAHMKYPMASIQRDEIEKTIKLLMTDYPQPEGHQALVLYMFKQNEEDSIHTYDGTTDKYKNEILQYLKHHVPGNLEEFSFLDFIKAYTDAQKKTEIFTDSPIEKTLMLNFSCDDLTNYLGLPGFFLQDTQKWIVNIKDNLEKQEEQWGVHSVDIHNMGMNSRMYVNLKQGSALTQKMLGESFNGLVNFIKNEGKSDLALIQKNTEKYLKSAWLEHKITANIALHNQNEYDEQEDEISATKMKI